MLSGFFQLLFVCCCLLFVVSHRLFLFSSLRFDFILRYFVLSSPFSIEICLCFTLFLLLLFLLPIWSKKNYALLFSFTDFDWRNIEGLVRNWLGTLGKNYAIPRSFQRILGDSYSTSEGFS